MQTRRAHFFVLCRLCCGCALSLASLVLTSAHAADAWMKTGTRAHPAHDAKFLAYLPDDEAIDVVVTLKLRNRDALDSRVRKITQLGDPQFGHWMHRAEIMADYAPREDRATAVADYLKQSGFTRVQIASSRMLVTATGTTHAIRQAFHTEMGRYERRGRQGIANINDVEVPVELADTVLSVLGLQTVHRMHTMAFKAQGVLLASSVHGVNPVNFPLAYNATSLPAATTTKVGILTQGSMTQTIADLHQFQTQHNLPTINPTVVTVGTASTDSTNTVEWNIDSQSLLGMAGGQVAQMLLYAVNSLNDSDITQGLNRIVSDNIAQVINISLGLCETDAQADGSLAADDQIFQLAIAQGQTFAVSSGDSGSSECTDSGGKPVAGASYPASSPYVIAVGGTTLYTDSNGNYTGELVWSGTGGSPSLIEPRPVWQNAVVAGTKRGVPDIAFDADPSSGAIIIVNGGNQQWGGTSLASPIFAGAWARIQTANNARLGFPASWIYSRGAQHTTAFHDVTSGSNGGYSAAAGWDYTTGFGSFDVAATVLLTRSTLVVTASSPTIQQGQSLTLTATVSGNTPTGKVQFALNGVSFGAPVNLVNGVATLTTTQFTIVGNYAISAIYSGDPNNAGGGAATAFNETVKSIHDGDLNGDGVVDAADIALIERIALGRVAANSTAMTHGDINGDGNIDASDIEHVRRKALGLENF
jgi:pseudomonalisin